MGFLKLFSNKNADFLKDDEIEAAMLLQNIVKGQANGTPIPDGVAKLTIGIYHIAFNRTDKDLVPLQVLKSSKAVQSNPKLSHYLAILKIIRVAIENFISNPKVKAKSNNDQLFKEFMLQTIKSTVTGLNKI